MVAYRPGSFDYFCNAARFGSTSPGNNGDVPGHARMHDNLQHHFAKSANGKPKSAWHLWRVLVLLVLTIGVLAVWQPWQVVSIPTSVQQMAFELPDNPAVDELLISEVAEAQTGSTNPSIPAVVDAANEIKSAGVVESPVDVGNDFEITNALQLDINLSRAVVAGRKVLVEELISRGANVNSENTYTSGPLHNAAISGNLEIIQILLEHDADINARALVGAYPGETALHAAAFGGHQQSAELLLANGANVNAADQHSYTPIRRAVAQGDKTMVDLLIKNGADITIIDQGGMTLLHAIAPSRHVAVAERLIAEGVDINALDDSGFTPLDYAQGGQREMIEALVRHGGVCTTC